MTMVSKLEAQSLNDMGYGCPAEIHRPPPPAPPFRFLDLPGEIQNLIVKEVILSEVPITIHEPRFNRHPPPPPRPRSRPRYDRPVPVPPTPPLSRCPSQDGHDNGHTRLALMLTCRKFYREYWKIYYGDNVFDFNIDVFNRFSGEIPARCISQLRKIKFRMPHRQYHKQLWKIFSNMRRLEELELWLTEPVAIDETVEECCVKGVATCRRLKAITLRTAEAEGDGADQEQPSKKMELQDKLHAILESKAKKGIPSAEDHTDEGEWSEALSSVNSNDEIST